MGGVGGAKRVSFFHHGRRRRGGQPVRTRQVGYAKSPPSGRRRRRVRDQTTPGRLFLKSRDTPGGPLPEYQKARVSGPPFRKLRAVQRHGKTRAFRKPRVIQKHEGLRVRRKLWAGPSNTRQHMCSERCPRRFVIWFKHTPPKRPSIIPVRLILLCGYLFRSKCR